MTDPRTLTLSEQDILRVEDLSTWFEYKTRIAKAVRGVSFTVKKGKTLAIVGESGSGKSVTSLSLMGLLGSPGRIAHGEAIYRTSEGELVNLAECSEEKLRRLRGKEIAMIFQEPMTSLNPLFRIGDQISEMVLLHEDISKSEARSRALEMLKLVEIPDAERRLDDYPHQLSGGMRQRVMIAMSMVCNPSLLIADEPTTALDVTIQAQILDLMRRLQKERNMSIMFITHDMGVVAEIADEVAVMYAGEVVEQAPVKEIFRSPMHPYTNGLLQSIPNSTRNFDKNGQRIPLVPIEGTVPSLYDMPEGCSFSTRCPYAEAKCNDKVALTAINENHQCRCWKSEVIYERA